MAGYRIGTQAWYDAVRQRLVDISKELRKPETSQMMKDRLFGEQAYLIGSLAEHAGEGLVNNPVR